MCKQALPHHARYATTSCSAPDRKQCVHYQNNTFQSATKAVTGKRWLFGVVRIQTLISVGDRERRWCRKTLQTRGEKIWSTGKEQRSDCENRDIRQKKSEAKEEIWDGDKAERWGVGAESKENIRREQNGVKNNLRSDICRVWTCFTGITQSLLY